jgi:hypothetical protein
MKPRNSVVSAGMMLFVALVLVMSISVETALGNPPWSCDPVPCIPADATITSATLGLNVHSTAGSVVRVHRIIAPWTETGVTWDNFGASYHATVEGSFAAAVDGPITVDVTSAFIGWAHGEYANFGFLLEQGQTAYTSYNSSEWSYGGYRPYLQICYTTSAGSTCVILVRGDNDDCASVADAYIRETSPDRNGGSSTKLYTGLVNGIEKQTLIRFEFEICDEPCCGCRFTGGGVDTDMNWDHTLENGEMVRSLPPGIDRAQFGGQAGANTGQQPQPKGEWTHHQQRGPSGSFTFHGGTSSAPAGTEIDEIRCSDPGGCKPSGDPPSPAKQLDFDGIGTFRSIGGGKNTPGWPDAAASLSVNATAEGKGNKAFDGTYHWFEVNIDDLGEPGGFNKGAPDSGVCPSSGFGEKGARLLADCDCPDFYRITIYNGSTDINSLPKGPGDVIYKFYGYIDGGNLQLHRPTGYDLSSLNELAENWLEGAE